jgi:molybdopterin-guanine dinucleotide biosynthesis protein MobB
VAVRVVAIVGSSGSGKTTLIEGLIPVLRARGLSVSTIKHTHHHAVELDTPGKDSHRHRVAGASEVIVASDTGWARLATSPRPASLDTLLSELRPVDVVLIEGFKQLAGFRRVEVFRGAGMPLALADAGIDAVAAPGGLALPGYAGRRLALEDVAGIADFVLSD